MEQYLCLLVNAIHSIICHEIQALLELWLTGKALAQWCARSVYELGDEWEVEITEVTFHRTGKKPWSSAPSIQHPASHSGQQDVPMGEAHNWGTKATILT